MQRFFSTVLLFLLLSGLQSIFAQKNSFTFSGRDFLLNGKPFQIIGGEMHPARIPAEYWRHRIQMTKAMGCNTIAAYIFWNYHEEKEGVYDFSTWNRDLKKFIKIAQEEGMWVIVRPGPYVCAEWDFGGIPSYLLKYPDLKVRCMDPRYMKAATNYMKALADELRPLQITQGGPILMLQVENEYGSYGNDREYMKTLEKTWRSFGIDIPFFTGDGPTNFMLEAGSLPGCAVGLDSGYDQGCFDLAYSRNPGVPVFSSETYPGWLTHWGEKWQRPDTAGLLKEVRFLMDTKKSFNLYVIHGGTNFGFSAGANSGGKGYEPDVTSYDYDAPISEQGLPTAKYYALRKLLASYLPKGKSLPAIPEPVKSIETGKIEMRLINTVWKQLPPPTPVVQPLTFEALDQNQGYMLYCTKLIGHKSGKLVITQLHDYATVFLNHKYVGKIDRRLGENSIELPASDIAEPLLEILVEGMGHINFAQEIIDRKGITDRVSLNGMTLMNWVQYKLPMDEAFISHIGTLAGMPDPAQPGFFFKGNFQLETPGDCFLDLSAYTKGVVWVNGHNLGRYWNIGPQQRLYCPAMWLKKGYNEIVIFDMHVTEAVDVQGFAVAGE
ncbi:MAG: beta-galactosidase [Bacteroidales bacterium]|nr:beta-galactosidase [Bacteroidales bacterium]